MKNLTELKASTMVDMEESFKKLSDAVAECAKAQNDGKSAEVVKGLKKAATTELSRYNGLAAKAAYLGWGIDDDKAAVEKAIRALYVPGAKKVSYKADKNTGVIVGNISPALVKVDLLGMHDALGEGYFHAEEWFSKLEKMAFIVAGAINKDLGGSIAFQYAISEAAQAFEFAADANPASNKSVVKALQAVVDDILYIDSKNKKGESVNTIKCTSKHWAFIREAMTRKGGVGEIIMCNTARVAEYVTEVIHLVLTEGNVSLTAE